MKLYKMEVYVFDFENSDVGDIIDKIENTDYFYPQVKKVQVADIGEWNDDHILNKVDTNIEVFRSYFGG